MALLKLLFNLSVLSVPLLGCSGLFLYPDHTNYFPDVHTRAVIREGFIPTPDGEKLHYWVVPAQVNKVVSAHPKGMVIQVHGNAQNLSAHVRNLGWMIEAGYNLAIFDYRGYGQSTGKASLDGAYQDTATALDYLVSHENPDHLPVFFYGQSLGGSLLLKTVSTQPKRWSPKMIVVESSFYSYPQIGRQKLADFWLTWPLQWMAYLVLSNEHGLKDQELQQLSPTPVVLFYSENDPVVPYSHGPEIFKGLAEPKKFYSYKEPAHAAAMWVEKGRFREILLDEMAAAMAVKSEPQK